MAKIKDHGDPVEIIGVTIKKTEIQQQVGLGLNKQIVDIAKTIINAGIQDKSSKAKCAELILRMADRMKEIKKFKDAIVKKMKAAVADAEEPFKNAFVELENLKKQLSDLYTEYDRKEKAIEAERIRKELQAEEDRRAAEKKANQEKMKAENEFDLLAPIEPEKKAEEVIVHKVVPNVEIKTTPQRIEGVGTLSIRKIQRVRIINPALIPEAYKVPSEKKLLDAYESGITSIPGAEFYEETSTRSLTR